MKWWQIWIWEIAIIHRIFLGAKRSRISLFIVPTASFLIESSTFFKNFYLTSKFCIDSTPNWWKWVNIFELNTRSKFFLAMRANRNIHITTQLSFFHIRIRSTTPTHQFLNFFKVREHISFGTKIWLCHNFHKWRTRTIVVTKRFSISMHKFPGIIFDMHMMNAESFQFAINKSSNFPAHRDWMVHLRNLVRHRQIRIKIAFSVKFTHILHMGRKCVTRANCQIYDTLRKCRQLSRKSHTNGTNMNIWLWRQISRILTSTKHFRLRLDTHMRFETHNNLVFIVIIRHKKF